MLIIQTILNLHSCLLLTDLLNAPKYFFDKNISLYSYYSEYFPYHALNV